ncbi:MAG: ISL3 family transposase [Actinomycetes bacterium]
MRLKRVWARLLGVEHTVVEQVEFDEDADAIVAAVRPARRRRRCCGICGRRSPGFDQGEGRRRWRALDLGVVRAFLEADAPRVACREHGVVVAQVPWARHDSGFTRAFEDTAAWLAVHTSRVAVAELLRVAWRTVGRIVARVAQEAETSTGIDRLAGLRRIGIDEISHKRGHRYLTVVVDHDTGRLVWAAPGHDEATLERFFDLLGQARSAQLTLISADAAGWIAGVVARRCPAAALCLDPFHVVRWATDALDQVRRETWNAARRGGHPALARELKGARFALWKNPEDLTVRQRGKLARVAEVNRRLYRAYLLKEELRLVFKLKGVRAVALLDAWLVWARRCRIPAFVKLARSITDHRAGIRASLLHGLSNGLVESVNTRIRLLTRIAFGFKSPEALIGLAMLSVGGLCPPLPGRAQPTHG